jgi:PAS domain S-box-containing protein
MENGMYGMESLSGVGISHTRFTGAVNLVQAGLVPGLGLDARGLAPDCAPSLAGLLSLQSAALEYAANGVLITDRAGAIIWSNPAFSHLTGYSRSEVMGRNPRLLKSGAHEKDFYRRMWGQILQGHVWADQITNVRRDGTHFHKTQTIVPVRDSGGTISTFFSVLQEVTDSSSIEASLRESEKRYRALVELESHKAVDAERARVARDMHDELGANLTRIKVLAERMEQDCGQSNKALDHARRIALTARSVSQSLDEIVWAVDPQKDRLEGLGLYLIRHVEEFLASAGLRCRLELPEVLPDLMVSAAKRHLVFCVVKEALNNIVKHAQATEVRLRLEVRNNLLMLLISDNGRGLVRKRLPAGRSGLTNMRKRMAEAGGRCLVLSRPDQGTNVSLVLSLS